MATRKTIAGKWMVIAVAAAAAGLAGCQSGDHYYWGHYEDLVYVSYADPGKISADVEAKTLRDDINAAASAGKPVPPGVHAHLGNLYFKLGDLPSARSEFETEKRLFPEFAVLMDRMIAKVSEKSAVQ